MEAPGHLTSSPTDSIGVGEGRALPTSRSSIWPRCAPSPDLLDPAAGGRRTRRWRPGGSILPLAPRRRLALILTRQALPTLDRAKYASAEGVARGAYILADADDGKPEVLSARQRQ